MTRLAFRTKLVLSITVPIAALAAFFLWYFPSRYLEVAERALEERALGLSNVLANLEVPALEFEQPADAEAQFNTVSKDRDLRYVAVVKLDGTIFSKFYAPGVKAPDRALAFSPERTISQTDKYVHV